MPESSLLSSASMLMSWGFAIWLGLGAMIGAVWIVRRVAIALALRDDMPLSPESWDTPPTPAPRLSVLIAAKDEQDNIEACVTSLLEQDYPNYEIIVIDDRSTDDTPKILARLQRRADVGNSRAYTVGPTFQSVNDRLESLSHKLRVLTVDELPAGWFGKHHAMHLGVQAADGDWLCFTDADCLYTSRRALSVAMREAAENRIDFLSIMPLMRIERPWEHVIMPVCAAVLIYWFQPRRVNDPNRPAAYANGAFMLMTRRCYQTCGGHERVRTAINEDVPMAHNAKRLGFRLRVKRNAGLYDTRMYATPREAWHGWSRIFYGCLETRTRIALAAAFVAFFSLFPWLSLAAAICGGVVAQPSIGGAWPMATVFWSVVVAIQLWSVSRWYTIVGSRPRWCLGYLPAAAVTLGMLLDAFFKVGGLTTAVWRGVRYRRGEPVGCVLDAPLLVQDESGSSRTHAAESAFRAHRTEAVTDA